MHLVTENFTFTPEKIDQESEGSEGHAHVYVDGKKIARNLWSLVSLNRVSLGSAYYSSFAERK